MGIFCRTVTPLRGHNPTEFIRLYCGFHCNESSEPIAFLFSWHFCFKSFSVLMHFCFKSFSVSKAFPSQKFSCFNCFPVSGISLLQLFPVLTVFLFPPFPRIIAFPFYGLCCLPFSPSSPVAPWYAFAEKEILCLLLRILS